MLPKHGAHQGHCKTCGLKPRTKSCLSHLGGKGKKICLKPCSDEVFTSMLPQGSVTALNSHGTWSGQNIMERVEKSLHIYGRDHESSDKPHSWGSGSLLLRAEGGRPGMAQGRGAVRAAGCPESSCTESLSTPSAASCICLSLPLTMLSRGHLCACPLFPCWADVLYRQQMLVLALSNRSFHWQREWQSFLKKNKITSLFWGLLPMFIKKFIFYLKMWHFKVILL